MTVLVNAFAVFGLLSFVFLVALQARGMWVERKPKR